MIQILDVRNKTLIHYPLEYKLVFWGTARRFQIELFVQNWTELLSKTWPLIGVFLVLQYYKRNTLK